jgi:hypothetical protein
MVDLCPIFHRNIFAIVDVDVFMFDIITNLWLHLCLTLWDDLCPTLWLHLWDDLCPTLWLHLWDHEWPTYDFIYGIMNDQLLPNLMTSFMGSWMTNFCPTLWLHLWDHEWPTFAQPYDFIYGMIYAQPYDFIYGMIYAQPYDFIYGIMNVQLMTSSMESWMTNLWLHLWDHNSPILSRNNSAHMWYYLWLIYFWDWMSRNSSIRRFPEWDDDSLVGNRDFWFSGRFFTAMCPSQQPPE